MIPYKARSTVGVCRGIATRRRGASGAPAAPSRSRRPRCSAGGTPRSRADRPGGWSPSPRGPGRAGRVRPGASALLQVPEHWQKATYTKKIQLQSSIFSKKPSYHYPTFGTPDFSLIFQQKRDFAHAKSLLVAPRGIEPLSSG